LLRARDVEFTHVKGKESYGDCWDHRGVSHRGKKEKNGVTKKKGQHRPRGKRKCGKDRQTIVKRRRERSRGENRSVEKKHPLYRKSYRNRQRNSVRRQNRKFGLPMRRHGIGKRGRKIDSYTCRKREERAGYDRTFRLGERREALHGEREDVWPVAGKPRAKKGRFRQ